MRTGSRRVNAIRPEFVDFVPATLIPGVFYISDRFKTASHLCACGCGEKVVTPLSPVKWQIYREGDAVTLVPSIGNWDYACRSHYFIRRNKIVWAAEFSVESIARVQARDRRDAQNEIAARNALKRRTMCQWSRDVLSAIGKFFGL